MVFARTIASETDSWFFIEVNGSGFEFLKMERCRGIDVVGDSLRCKLLRHTFQKVGRFICAIHGQAFQVIRCVSSEISLSMFSKQIVTIFLNVKGGVELNYEMWTIG